MTWVTFLKEKYEAIENFKAFKDLVENDIDLKIKFLRLHKIGKFTSNEFDEFCENHVIKRHCFTTRTHRKMEL